MATRHEQLKDHVKKRVKLGHDLVKVKHHLMGKGFLEEEIHKAIDAALIDLRRAEDLERNVVSMLRPSKGKLVLPTILLIMLLAHFFVNVFSIPVLGNDMCDSVNYMVELNNLTLGKNITEINIDAAVDIEKKIVEKELNIVKNFRLVFSANFPLIFTKLYWLDPWFPTPCEARSLFKTTSCKYYISESQYDCLKDNVAETKLSTLFTDDAPDYAPISFFSASFHTLLLLFISYLLNASILHFYRKHRHKYKPAIVELFEFGIGLIALLIIIFAFYLYIYLIRLAII